ncbi:uncharacterized protein B0H64DRAFT_408650 [Chaetomium fimeti]|uniref:Nephrocystin 3-like N-terminal domain-containing protein n=1 Tax=Chaetomium fimeti TaxID=1854472 RepID=A0AAE0HAH6_9PEZI|nr:hypothetical protein B0H64DRAFT_408650 [Chaetomium fimeti]
MERLFERFKLRAKGKGPKKMAKGATSTSEEDKANSTEAQPEPASPGDGVGPLVLVDKIGGGSAGAGASGTDIVFVHGLRGRRAGTWSKDGICWPQHLLGNDLNNVRVITWGYDATVANAFHAASKESIFGHADTLLEDLARLRVGTTRPIVFVCHSLGGLVVKEALIKADNYNNHQRHPTLGDIFAKTTGVIFMGTPHRGSSKESYGDLLVKIAKVALRQPNDQLLQTLRPDSHILENQREQFTTISSRMSVVCIREELPTSVGVIVPETSASYDGFNVRRGAINANHMDMVRFTSDREPGYQRTLGFISELCHARQAAQQVIDEALERRNDEILEILNFPSINDRELNIEKAYADTCAWIMDDGSSAGTSNHLSAPRFKSWLKDGDSTFWISGKAGCGKSTLMKFIYQHEDTEAALAPWAGNKKLIKAGYFFLERGDNLQKSREGMIRSILYQVLGQRRDLIRVAFPTFFSWVPPRPETINSWKNLDTAFDAMLCGLKDSKVCLFIDGLDEYRMVDKEHEYTQEQLDHIFDGDREDESWGLTDWIVDGHREIAEFVLRFNQRPNARICLSSRELGVFEQQFSTLSRLEVHHYTAGSIKDYCEARLAKEAPGLTDPSQFVSLITKKSRGVFLWVRIVVDMLVKGTAAGDSLLELFEALESLPPRLGGRNGLYMRMMQNVKQSHLPEAERLFQLVMHYVLQPEGGGGARLDIITLFLAQEGHIETNGDGGLRAIKDKIVPKTWEGLRPRWTGLQRRLKSRCGGLLEGVEDVQFMHQTAKEFMSRPYLWDLIFPKPSGFLSGPDKDLALLSGFIRRVKCCQEVALVAQMTRRNIWTMSGSHTLASRLLSSCLLVACRIDQRVEAFDNYASLLDELDATGQYLTAAQVNDIPAQAGSNWIGLFLQVGKRNPTGRTSVLEIMTLLGHHRYVGHKIQGKGLLPTQLQGLLSIVSQSYRARWEGLGIMVKGPPRPEVVDLLFAMGANPNSKLDESDDSSPEPNQMDSLNKPVGNPKGFTAWTALLQNIHRGEFFDIEKVMPSVIQLFLENGADRMAQFHGKDMELFTVEDAIKKCMKNARLSVENLDRDKFPDIVALLESKADKAGRPVTPLLEE